MICEDGFCELDMPFVEEEVTQESICEACGQDCNTTEKCLFKEN